MSVDQNKTVLFQSTPEAPVQIVFRNFAGREGQYNQEGDRNFCILLDPALAEAMLRDGWNIKTLKAREEGDLPTPYLQISIGYKFKPPRVVVITSKGRTDVPEEMLEIIDWVDIAKVDLSIRPYNWAVSGKTGVKAYLKSIFITIEEDPLALMYDDIPEIGGSPANALEGHAPLEIESGQTPTDGLDEDIVDAEIVED